MEGTLPLLGIYKNEWDKDINLNIPVVFINFKGYNTHK